MYSKNNFKRCKYIHIFQESVFLKNYLIFLNKYFNSSEHCFILLPENHSDTFECSDELSNFQTISPKSRLHFIRMIFKPHILKLIYQTDQIICHSLSMYDICLLALHPLLIKKAVWVIWGYDLYDYRDKDTQYKSYLSKILFAFKKRIAKRIKCVISRNPDCALLRQWYHSTAKCFPIEPLYGSGKQITLQPDYTPKDHLNIIIGNSATQTNRHLDVLKILSKFSQENLRIYLPLSYGDMEYAKLVGDTAKELFGDKVIILDTFMPPDDYRKLIQTMDVAIFNNNRQQALGNITTSFRTGVKVYLNEDSPLCDICNEWGLTYHLISSLESISYDEFKYRDQLEGNKNSKQVYDTFKIENAVRGWTDVFNMARNK